MTQTTYVEPPRLLRHIDRVLTGTWLAIPTGYFVGAVTDTLDAVGITDPLINQYRIDLWMHGILGWGVNKVARQYVQWRQQNDGLPSNIAGLLSVVGVSALKEAYDVVKADVPAVEDIAIAFGSAVTENIKAKVVRTITGSSL